MAESIVNDGLSRILEVFKNTFRIESTYPTVQIGEHTYADATVDQTVV